MRRFVIFVLIVLFYMVIHEGAHIAAAAFFDEFEAITWNVIGPEVIFKTPVEQRSGFQWALISGVSNLITIILGYLMLFNRQRFSQASSLFSKGAAYFLTVLLLIADPLNLSIGPFFYGGDVYGIAEGLDIHRYVIQFIFLIILLVNRELVASKLLPAYDVESDQILFRPWIFKPERN